jgi:hypothetical protein
MPEVYRPTDRGHRMETSALFEDREPLVKELYEELLKRIQMFGPVEVQTKKSSIHLVNRVAFLGVHPKKGLLELNIVSEKPIKHTKVLKTEQISRGRCHNRIRLTKMNEIDLDLMKLIHDAYDFLR